MIDNKIEDFLEIMQNDSSLYVQSSRLKWGY